MELVQLIIMGGQRGSTGFITATAFCECWLDDKPSIVQFFSLGERAALSMAVSALKAVAARQLADLKRRLAACGVDVALFDELAESIDYSSVMNGQRVEVESARSRLK